MTWESSTPRNVSQMTSEPWYMRGRAPSFDEFEGLSTADAEAFVAEFIARIPLCVRSLEARVKATDGFERWRANYSPRSLDLLTKWVQVRLFMRPMTAAERRMGWQPLRPLPNWKRKALEQEPLPHKEVLTDRTIGILVEIGMYIGEMLRRESPLLVWTRNNDVRGARYNEPFLMWRKDYGFFPIDFLRGWAYRQRERAPTAMSLRRFYENWVQKIPELEAKRLSVVSRATRRSGVRRSSRRFASPKRG